MTRWSHGGQTRQQRGYGADWRRLRASILAAEPLCRICSLMGRVAAATEVDHIQPFAGLHDPLRLDASNCRPVCSPCHRQITAAHAHGQALRIVGSDGWPVEV